MVAFIFLIAEIRMNKEIMEVVIRVRRLLAVDMLKELLSLKPTSNTINTIDFRVGLNVLELD